jgi:L-lysine exporter family protein LysE/ArgO
MEKSPFLFGLILQSSMILALGAQNLFVLEKGILKERPFVVALLCSSCDVFLILLGVLGAGSFFANNAYLTIAFKIFGAAFLLKYAWGKFKEASSKPEARTSSFHADGNLKSLVSSTLAVSLLNPHVYLDAVVLIGGYSTQFESLEEKFHFALGAGGFSVLWFFALSFGASLFSSALNKPTTMRVINYASSFLMGALGINLLGTL